MAPSVPTISLKLADQKVVHATADAKIKLSILGTALVDALGGPVEFHRRFSFPLTTSFGPNANFTSACGNILPAGTWTDDTSMTLCLARSIAAHGFNEARQLEAYAMWYQKGELSAIDKCFDIGGTTLTALNIYLEASSPAENPHIPLTKIRDALSSAHCAGNGSLMRVLPVGLAYWRDPAAAKKYAGRSSSTTHPNPLCVEVCEFWTGMITTIMQHSITGHAAGSTSFSKLHLLEYISDYPFKNELLKQHLSLPNKSSGFAQLHQAARSLVGSSKPSKPTTNRSEAHYWKHHPILRLVIQTAEGLSSPSNSRDAGATPIEYDARTPPPRSHAPKVDKFPFALPSEKDLPSSGYVLHSAVAALYCFFATETFEDGAIMAVNLGDDADTVGAIYGGLAGCWYASCLRQSTTETAGSGTCNRSGTPHTVAVGPRDQAGAGIIESPTSSSAAATNRDPAWATAAGRVPHHSGDWGGDGSGGNDLEARVGIGARHLFWSEKVSEWKAGLVRRGLVEQVADELVQYEKGL